MLKFHISVVRAALDCVDSAAIVVLPTTKSFIEISSRELDRENVYFTGGLEYLSKFLPGDSRVISRSQALSLIGMDYSGGNALPPVIFSFPDQITSPPDIQIFSVRNGLRRGFCALEILATSKYGARLYIWRERGFVVVREGEEVGVVLRHLNDHLDDANEMLGQEWLAREVQSRRSMRVIMKEATARIHYYQSLLAMCATETADVVTAVRFIDELNLMEERIGESIRLKVARS